MPDPDVRESQTVPGAWDVRREDGSYVPVAPQVAQGMGFSLAPVTDAQVAAEVAALPEAQQEQAVRQQMAIDEQARQVGAPTTVSSPQREALERRVTLRDEAQAAEAGRAELQQLARGVAQGDRGAIIGMRQRAQSGDVEAERILREMSAYQEAGLLTPRRAGGSGGARTRRTETTRFSGPGRAPTEQESAEMQRLRQEQDAIERERMVGLAGEVDAEATAMEQGAALMQNAEQTYDRLQRQQQAQEDMRQRELDRRSRELDTLAREASQMSVDPRSVLARGQTTSRVSAALGILLGGLGDALTGGNQGLGTALSIIDNAVSRDIDAQKHAIASKRQDVATASNLLAQARARFGDEKAAEAAAKAAIFEQVQRQVASLGRTAQGQAQQARLQQLMAEMEAAKNAARQQALQAGLGTTEVVMERRQGSGGGPARPEVDLSKLVGEEPTVNAEERQRLAEQRNQNENTLAEVDRALSLLDDTDLTGPVGSRVPLATSESARELDRTLRRIATPLATAAFGALGNEDQLLVIAEQNGLTVSNRADDIRRNLLRIRDQVRGQLEATELGVGEQAVQERAGRAGEVRQRVTMQDGRLEDVARSWTPEVDR